MFLKTGIPTKTKFQIFIIFTMMPKGYGSNWVYGCFVVHISVLNRKKQAFTRTINLKKQAFTAIISK